MAEVYPAGIRYTSRTGFTDSLESCFTEINGELLCYAGDGDETEVVAGCIKAFYVDVYGAISYGYDIYDLFDQLEDASACYRWMYDDATGELSEPFVRMFGEALQNVLLLQRLELLPQFRGAKLGLAAMHRTIEQFGHGCGYVVLKPMPLQVEPVHSAEKQRWHSRLALDKFPADIEAGLRRLAEYYSLLGFRPIPNSEWMALNLDFERPSLEEIGFESDW